MTCSAEDKSFARRYFKQMDDLGVVPVVFRFGGRQAFEMRNKRSCVQLQGEVKLRGVYLPRWGLAEPGTPQWVKNEEEAKQRQATANDVRATEPEMDDEICEAADGSGRTFKH